jgi:hypothetical protein
MKKEKWIHYLFILGVFLGLFAFFYIAHPLILSDTDDWYNSSYWRRPLPIWGKFGAIKVFPETLLPLCSMIAVNYVMPLKHNYLMSLALVYGVVSALFVTVYVLAVSVLVKAFSKASFFVSDMLSFCFLMLHFLMYKDQWSQNVHLLWSHDVTCLFHYTFSTLLGACLVMYFIKKEVADGEDVSDKIWSGEYGFVRAGLLLLLVYLAIFSNMFNNIVLSAFSGIHALTALIVGWDKSISFSDRIKAWFQKKWLFVVIVIAWFVAVLFQSQDPRNDIARSQGATGSLTGAVSTYFRNFISANKMAALMLVIFTAIFAICAIKYKNSLGYLGRAIIEIALSFVIASAYLIILCGVSSPVYLERNDVKISLFFYILLGIVLAFGWAVGESPNAKLEMILPFVVFIIGSQSLNYCKSYSDYNMNGLSYEQELVISNDLIEQFVDADEKGLDEFDLHVIVNPDADDNWPYPSYAGELVGDALFRHGMISRQIKANTVFDQKKNGELMISFK